MRTGALCAAAVLGLSAGAALAGTYTAGNLVVSQVGDGSAALGSGATTVMLKEWDFGSTAFINPLTLNSGATGVRCTSSGSATSEGMLTLSRDKRYLIYGGYDAVAGTAGIAGTTSAAAPRAAARVDMNQGTTITGFNDMFSANNIRSAISDDGSQYWTAGANEGIRYGTTGPSSSIISSTNVNNRVLNFNGTELLFSAGAGNRGIYTLGSPAPTSGPVVATRIIDTGAASSAYDFFFANANTIYICDDRSIASGGGIQKWTFNGSAWSLLFTIGTGTGSTVGARGLTGSVDGSGNVQLYAITAESSLNRLISVGDTVGSVVAPTTVNTLATAGTNTIFRGVDFAPVPAPGSLALLALGGVLAGRRRR